MVSTLRGKATNTASRGRRPQSIAGFTDPRTTKTTTHEREIILQNLELNLKTGKSITTLYTVQQFHQNFVTHLMMTV
jgi:hypothetical protein